MAVPVCFDLPDIPSQLSITLPGGAQIASLNEEITRIQTACNAPMNLMGQLGPALAPLKPLFDVLDTVIQIFKCIEAIPKAIATFNPTDLLKCLPELAEKIDALLRLIPQLSIPFMILDFIDAVIAILDCVIGTINQLIAQAALLASRLNAAAQLNDPNLDAILVCSGNDIAALQQSASDSISGLGTLLGVINLFLKLIGIEPIEFPTPEPGIPLGDALGPINDLIDTLKQIRAIIPVP